MSSSIATIVHCFLSFSMPRVDWKSNVSCLALVGLSERFWLNLQIRYDLEREKDRRRGRLEQAMKVLYER